MALLLLDINMPILNGFDTLKLVKERFREYDETVLMRPMICYLSQLDYTGIGTFIKEDELPDCYLEKPLPLSELAALF